MKALKLFGLLLAMVVLISPVSVWAQGTASSGFITGTVTDPGGAVIPNASVELENTATHAKLSTTSNAAGVYVFSGVPPGQYKLTITAQGFRTWEVIQMSISIARSYTRDAQLEIGAMTEKVEVVATAAAELHTHDASVGNVYGGTSMLRMPTRNRSVAALLHLQPLVMPSRGASTDDGGQVAGARSDQTVYLLDGGDVTNNTEGSGGYISGFSAAEGGPAIPVPQESIEEFRVGTTNPNATFGRSQGAQVTMATKTGSNEFHGSAYWYHQNDNLDANLWQNNRAGRAPANCAVDPVIGRNDGDACAPKPEKKDNRYGFSAGGPIWKDWTHIYGHFEGRRFPRSSNGFRMVPSETLRRGVIFVVNGTPCAAAPAGRGCVNLNPDATEAPPALFGAFNPAVCGAGIPCDPLGLGMSPTVEAMLALYPLPNDFSVGDPSNSTVGNFARFRLSSDNSITDDFTVVKLDQKITDKWNSFFSYRYNRNIVPGTLAGALPQIDIAGISPGCTNPPCTTRGTQSQPRFFIIGVNGQVTPTLTSETRLSWSQSWWAWTTQNPFPQVAGTAAALDIGNETICTTSTTCIADPVNIDTQNGRSRSWDGDDYVAQENLTWVRGKHTIQFGGTFRQQKFVHVRTDRVTGGLSTGPIFYSQDGAFLRFPTAASGNTYRPPGVSGGAATRWALEYTALLGILDRSAQVATRNTDDAGNFVVNPFGAPLFANVDVYAVDGFVQDIFRITPTLTATIGMIYSVQRPPVERDGKAMVPVFADTLNAVEMDSYFANRRNAALQGQLFNPRIGYMPVNQVPGRKYVTEIDWNNWAPRIALAWNPAFDNFLFGNRKTVMRAGWGVTYTRMNGVGLVMTPILSLGPASIHSCGGPNFAGTCTNASNGTSAETAFRIGPAAGGWSGDGTNILPSNIAPPIDPLPTPLVPAPFSETRNFAIDPGMSLGQAHSFDFTWQRELPGNMLIELGYVGRLGKNLTQNSDINDVPFMLTDPISGQTLLTAFENLACELRGGEFGLFSAEPTVCPGGGQPVIDGTIADQPFFENFIGAQLAAQGGTDCLTDLGQSCTSFLLDNDPDDIFFGGLGFVMNFISPVLFSEMGSQLNNWTTDGGKSFYHSGFVTLRKRMSYGLQFDVNYTVGRSIDEFGLNQENTGFSYQSVHNHKLDRGLSIWDRTHVLNATFHYELPFGRGKTWASESGVMDKVVGGWSLSGVFQASSGITNGSYVGTDAGAAIFTGQSYARPAVSPFSAPAGVHQTGDAVNMYADPAALQGSLRRCIYSVDGRCGNEFFRGLPHWNLDFSVYKRTSVTEKVAIGLQFDFLNLFNRMEFNNGTTDLDSGSFGVLGSQFGGLLEGPRRIQFGIRVDF